MRDEQTPTKLIDQLRSWFFAKDRSVYLAPNTFIDAPEIATPGNPATNRRRIYPKSDGWYSLEDDGTESLFSMFKIASSDFSAVASVTLSSIPSTYLHLVLYYAARSNTAAETDNTIIQFNGDTAANYDYDAISFLSTSTLTTAIARATASPLIARIEGNNSRANNYPGAIIDIPFYKTTGWERWAYAANSGSFGDVSANTDLIISTQRVRWRSTSAITSILLAPNGGGNFTGSVTLYGIL